MIPFEDEIEQWKYIEGWEGYYQISSYGRLKSFHNKKHGGKILSPGLSGGYVLAQLYRRGYRKDISVHRLVALTFISNPKNKPEVNHKNGIKNDNHVDNLEWCTASENVRHSFYVLKNKPSQLGIRNGTSSKQVVQIDKNTNHRIAIHPSASEAQRQTSIIRKNISRAIRNNSTAGGFKWKFL